MFIIQLSPSACSSKAAYYGRLMWEPPECVIHHKKKSAETAQLREKTYSFIYQQINTQLENEFKHQTYRAILCTNYIQ